MSHRTISADARRSLLTGGLGLFLLSALVLLAYSNSFDAPFYFDDHRNIVRSPLVRDLGLFVKPWQFEQRDFPEVYRYDFYSRPLAYFSFALNYRLHGLDRRGYHVVNVGIHLAATLILFRLLRRLFSLPFFESSALGRRGAWTSFLAAALFGAHPIQTQAVTYISQRMASLAALFCLVALASYLSARLAISRAGRAGWLACCVLSLLAGMLTKESAFLFPLILLLFEWLFFAAPWRRRLAWLALPLSTLALIPMSFSVDVSLRQRAEEAVRSAGSADGKEPAGTLAGSAVATAESPKTTTFEYRLTQTRVLATYLRLLAWPAGQTLDYDYPLSRSLFEWRVVASGALLATLLALGLIAIRIGAWRDPGWRLAGFGILWFLLLSATESGLVRLDDLIFEHRLYLPATGLMIAAVVAVMIGVPSGGLRVARAALVAVVLALACVTWARNDTWSDERRFWYDALRKSPHKARVLYNVGFLEYRLGRPSAAESLFLRALSENPRHVSALLNLATLARQRADLVAALDYLGRALEIAPRRWSVVLDIRNVLIEQGRVEEAERRWHEAVRLAGSEERAREGLRRANSSATLPEAVAGSF